MAILPEQMDKLDLRDTTGSLRRVEQYIRYMAERLEFFSGRTTRTVTQAGVSAVGLYQAVLTLADTVAVLQASITGLNTRLTEIRSQIQTMDAQIKSLEEQIAALSGLEAALDALQARVTALEGAGAEAH